MKAKALKKAAVVAALAFVTASPVHAAPAVTRGQCVGLANAIRTVAVDRDKGSTQMEQLQSVAAYDLPPDWQHLSYLMSKLVYEQWSSVSPNEIYFTVLNSRMAE